MSDINDFRLVHAWTVTRNLEFARLDQARILAGQANGTAAMLVDQVDDILVDLPAQHHLDHVHGLRVSHPHAIDKFALDVQALEQVANLRAAAVHDHRVDAYGFHQHDIPGKAVLQVITFHGVSAILDDDGLAGKALDIRQCFGQYQGNLGGGITAEHGDLLSPEIRI